MTETLILANPRDFSDGWECHLIWKKKKVEEGNGSGLWCPMTVCDGHRLSPIFLLFQSPSLIFILHLSIKDAFMCYIYRYEFHIPFLKTHGIVSVNGRHVSPTYRNVFSPRLAPRLSFVGLSHKGMTFLPAELQSMWIARALSGKVTLPSETDMLHETEQVYQEMESKGIPPHSHNFQMDYIDWLSDQLGINRPPQKLKDFYARFIEQYRNDHEGFRYRFEDDLVMSL
ncbi:hypothetical protein R6Q57_027619 [Mikania cordata]